MKKEKKVTCAFSLRPSMIRKIDMEAEEKDISRSRLVQDIIQEHFMRAAVLDRYLRAEEEKGEDDAEVHS